MRNQSDGEADKATKPGSNFVMLERVQNRVNEVADDHPNWHRPKPRQSHGLHRHFS